MLNFLHGLKCVSLQIKPAMNRAASQRLMCLRSHLLGGSAATKPISRNMSSADGISPAAKAVLATRKSVNVLNSHISYLDTAMGDNVVLFLHGNPTSAFLWRNIIPHVQPVARCVAPDLIGMGHSGKLDIKYKYVEHYKYLSTWIDQMNFPGKITVVCHDWGAGLGFHWCNQNRSRVRGIVHMESFISPVPSWDIFPEDALAILKALRSDAGEELVLKESFFFERMLIANTMRELSDTELEEYRAPFKTEQSRWPTLTWAREMPIASDGPEDVVKIATDYHTWLSSSSDVPKLFVNAKPGFFSPWIMEGIANWPNQKIVEAKGLHFLQEDSPDDIGKAIKDFLEDLK